MNTKLYLRNLEISQFLVIIFLSISLAVFSASEVLAEGDVTWGSFSHPQTSFNMRSGGVFPPILERVNFEIMDDALIGNEIKSVTVKITSSLDSDGITLTLPNENNDGTIQNEKTVLLRSESLFQIGDTAKFSISKICVDLSLGCQDDVIDTVDGNDFGGLWAISETSPSSFVPIHLTETGVDTDTFEGKIKFTSDLSIPAPFPEISELQVSPGDTISIRDFFGLITNGIILPTSEDKNGIIVENEGIITISYVSQDGFIHTAMAETEEPPGGGFSGGPVNTGLVLDSRSNSSTSSGGCSRDCQPPTLGVDKDNVRFVDHGFSYNGNPVDVNLFYTPYPLITVNVGEENTAVLRVFEESGVDNIAHVGLAFGLGKNEYFSESKATITLDRTVIGGEIKKVYDPENVLENVRIETKKESCFAGSNSLCLVVTIFHTFREPLDFNMVGTNIWDLNKNSWQNFFNHGIEITGQSLNPPDEHIGIDKGNLITLYETGKTTAVDANGNIWNFDREWKKNFIPQGKIDDGITSHGYDRNHVHFEIYKKEQELEAQKILNDIFDGKSIYGYDLEEPKTIHYKILSRAEDAALQNTIESEKLRAEKIFSSLFSKIRYNHGN